MTRRLSDARFDAVVIKPVVWEALCEAIATARAVHRRYKLVHRGVRTAGGA